MSTEPTVIGLSVWLLGTLGHYGLTALWARRSGLAGSTRDERWFITMLVGTATLLVALHTVAATVGLTLTSVLSVLAAGHGLMAWAIRTRPAAAPDAVPARTSTVMGGLEVCGSVVLAGCVLTWLARGPARIFIWGTDAATYHVPVAINLALGASPFDLPTTQHLYPMASSTLAAWFLVPIGDPLLVDLVMIIPFLLAAASLGWIFRLVTGQSGLAWCSWFILALFATPLFRQASLMSADLMFAATFVALLALLLGVALGVRRSHMNIGLVGLATGMLIGAKTTGLMAAIFVLGLAGAAWLVVERRRLWVGRPALALCGWWSAAGVLAIGAGGLWLVRNWWLFGSPIAPYGFSLLGLEIFRGPLLEPSLHLSILADVQQNAGYGLADRTVFWLHEWLGRWYLVALLPAVFVVVDAAASKWRGRSGSGPRLLVAATLVLTMVPAVWLLVGAPWTSLEWTNGLSLRYILPWFLSLSFMAWLGMFPANMPWYERPAVAVPAVGVAAVLSLSLLAKQYNGTPYPPAAHWLAVVAALGIWLVARFGRRLGRYVLLVIATFSLVGYAAWLTAHDRDARQAARARARAQPASQTQQLYAEVLEVERSLGRDCQSRRFFVISRFDEPLGLQSIPYSNRVYYAAREVQATKRTVDGMGPCDYIIASPAMLETQKAAELMQVLNPYARTAKLGAVGPFVLLGLR